MLVVIDHDAAGELRPGKHVIRRQRQRQVQHVHAVHANAVAPPARPGGQHHVIGTEARDVHRRHLAAGENLDVRQLRDHVLAPVTHPYPGRKAGQGAFVENPPAQLAVAISQRHIQPAPAKAQCRFEAGRSGAHHQHLLALRIGGDLLRVPAAPPLLRDRRVLRATQMHALIVRRAADVAADAFADFVHPSVADLGGQEGVGDRGSRSADEILDAAPDLAHHHVGRGEAADRDHGLRRQRFDEGDLRLLVAFAAEARRLRVIAERARDVHVPQVREFRQHGHDLTALALRGDAGRSVQLIDGEAHRHGAGVAHGLLGVLDHLAQQPHAVLQLAAILIGPPVVAGRQELEGQVIMPGIDIDDVETGALRPLRRVTLPAAEGADVREVHAARRGRQVVHGGDRRGGKARRPRPPVRGMRAAMPEFHARQAAVGMDGVGRQRQSLDVVIVPKGEEAIGRIVRGRMNRAVFGAHHTPAAFRLDAAQRCSRLRPLPALTDGVRRLVEAVGRRDGTDPHGLEKNVVAAVAQHRFAHCYTVV